MAVVRTRFIFWLFKAYVKKWGKQFIVFFLIGLFIFLLLLKFYPVIIGRIPFENKTIIGISGAITIDEIPEFIIYKAARGLTKVKNNGKVLPDLADRWEIKDKGRTYIFYLKKGVKFSDGTQFTAKTIQYAFKDVSISRPDDYTIVFKLKDEYAPFIITVSKPILRRGYIGIGDYIINNIELNGDFIKSIQLLSRKNKFKSEEYIFYPSNEALKVALALGEVTEVHGLTNTNINAVDINTFPNMTVQRKPNYSKLITLFFNNEDPVLSDKKLRNGLSYALPDEFMNGLRVYFPYPPASYFINNSLTEKKQDLDHADLLISSALETVGSSAKLSVHMKTLKKYADAAAVIRHSWKQIGVNVTIEEVDMIPATFQVYLGDFNVPEDPDQYTLWHSGQKNNITRLKNLRIDKLLEDGRRNTDENERLNIYNDFQKYLLDESPAAFLYFPYEYSVRRN